MQYSENEKIKLKKNSLSCRFFFDSTIFILLKFIFSFYCIFLFYLFCYVHLFFCIYLHNERRRKKSINYSHTSPKFFFVSVHQEFIFHLLNIFYSQNSSSNSISNLKRNEMQFSSLFYLKFILRKKVFITFHVASFNFFTLCNSTIVSCL